MILSASHAHQMNLTAYSKVFSSLFQVLRSSPKKKQKAFERCCACKRAEASWRSLLVASARSRKGRKRSRRRCRAPKPWLRSQKLRKFMEIHGNSWEVIEHSLKNHEIQARNAAFFRAVLLEELRVEMEEALALKFAPEGLWIQVSFNRESHDESSFIQFEFTFYICFFFD